MTRRRLDPLSIARIKRAARCPDCDSRVAIDQTTHPPVASIHHDPGCPAVAALRREGRTVQVAVVRRDDQTHESFTKDVAGIAGRFAEEFGAARVADGPYADLNHLGEEAHP